MGMEPYRFSAGNIPLLISVPHAGTQIPDAIAARMTDAALQTPDTDWHVDRLYDFAQDLGAHMLVATQSRFVVDLNRPPGDENLYPGQNTTGLCPVDTFDEEPIYKDPADRPGTVEISERVAAYWRPYHDKLTETLDLMRAQYGYALLWDAHSIQSAVPRFFDGHLPDLNLGNAGGASCDPNLADRLLDIAQNAEDYSAVLNGRFKGGYITRHYGDPGGNVHAVQLELSQATYMNEQPPYDYRADLAAGVKPVLRRLVEAMATFKPV